MLVDKPGPALGFILIYVGLIVFLIALPLFLRRFRKLHGWLAGLVFTICFAGAAVFLLFLYSGFDTVYSLDNDVLLLRSGILAHGRVELAQIKEIERVPVNWQGLGWALNRTGYCNRFSNCLRLKTDLGTLFLSPKNPDAFAEAIRSRQRRTSLLRRNLIFR